MILMSGGSSILSENKAVINVDLRGDRLLRRTPKMIDSFFVKPNTSGTSPQPAQFPFQAALHGHEAYRSPLPEALRAPPNHTSARFPARTRASATPFQSAMRSPPTLFILEITGRRQPSIDLPRITVTRSKAERCHPNLVSKRTAAEARISCTVTGARLAATSVFSALTDFASPSLLTRRSMA